MRQTSAAWKALWAAGNARLESAAVIDGTACYGISSPVINRALMQEGLSVGNAVSATCSFSIRTDTAIPRSARVVILMRLSDGETASEWLPAGTFYVSRRRVDAVTGLVTLECCDAMLKANAAYVPTGSWPRSMATVVGEIARLMGVALDDRTQLKTGDAYAVGLPEQGATLNQILGGIAAAHGGSWIITPENRLRLVPLVSASGAAQAEAAAVLSGIVGALDAGQARTVTGLRVAGDDGEALIGDDSGLVVSVDTPYMNDAVAADLAARLIGQTYQPFTATGAVYDPAAELGDWVRGGAGGEIASVLYGETATLGLAFRGDVTAPEAAELADEYPYIGRGEQTAARLRRLSAVVADKASIEDLEAVSARLDNLTASDIKTGIIHSADYETVDIPMLHPASMLYPAAELFPNYGERVVRGFAIDFSTGQIYGAFYSEQIARLEQAVAALQRSLVYPKART